jgi:5-methyltetrahydropteroyltriglutamate--homocysteine methyltransferase
MLQQAQNDYYKTEEEAAADYADAVNAEIKAVDSFDGFRRLL